MGAAKVSATYWRLLLQVTQAVAAVCGRPSLVVWRLFAFKLASERKTTNIAAAAAELKSRHRRRRRRRNNKWPAAVTTRPSDTSAPLASCKRARLANRLAGKPQRHRTPACCSQTNTCKPAFSGLQLISAEGSRRKRDRASNCGKRCNQRAMSLRMTSGARSVSCEVTTCQSDNLKQQQQRRL